MIKCLYVRMSVQEMYYRPILLFDVLAVHSIVVDCWCDRVYVLLLDFLFNEVECMCCCHRSNTLYCFGG